MRMRGGEGTLCVGAMRGGVRDFRDVGECGLGCDGVLCECA